MDNNKVLLPHHEQQNLCTTRLPYRQGRKLTAVKAYSITKESNHLLIFGVPSLNLRQETKAMFSKFGKLLQFTITTEHPAEVFTETYHAQFEKIQSSRLAKRMLDTKNYYGGSLHICYAPELESINETRTKLLQRKQDVIFRLRNLQKDVISIQSETPKGQNEMDLARNVQDVKKLNMGECNTISIGPSKKRKKHESGNKRPKSSLIHNEVITDNLQNCTQYEGSSNEFKLGIEGNFNCESGISSTSNDTDKNKIVDYNNEKDNRNVKFVDNKITDNIEIVDCTSVDRETVTNINEHLNYNKFGNEVIRKVPVKPLNRFKFNFNKT